MSRLIDQNKLSRYITERIKQYSSKKVNNNKGITILVVKDKKGVTTTANIKLAVGKLMIELIKMTLINNKQSVSIDLEILLIKYNLLLKLKNLLFLGT